MMRNYLCKDIKQFHHSYNHLDYLDLLLYQNNGFHNIYSQHKPLLYNPYNEVPQNLLLYYNLAKL